MAKKNSAYQQRYRYRHMRNLGYDPARARRAAKDGCYIATAVYGSYDCPQVWVLRRFRDQALASTMLGRAFIKVYYAVSPTMVKWFGNTSAFQRGFKKCLDKMVTSLMSRGYEDTPYHNR